MKAYWIDLDEILEMIDYYSDPSEFVGQEDMQISGLDEWKTELDLYNAAPDTADLVTLDDGRVVTWGEFMNGDASVDGVATVSTDEGVFIEEDVSEDIDARLDDPIDFDDTPSVDEMAQVIGVSAA